MQVQLKTDGYIGLGALLLDLETYCTLSVLYSKSDHKSSVFLNDAVCNRAVQQPVVLES